jgi:hypothetical protein
MVPLHFVVSYCGWCSVERRSDLDVRVEIVGRSATPLDRRRGGVLSPEIGQLLVLGLGVRLTFRGAVVRPTTWIPTSRSEIARDPPSKTSTTP